MSKDPGGTLVLALGNPLMGDDGFGIALLDRLNAFYRDRGNPTLMDGGTWGMSLLPAIEAASRLLIIDAIKLDRPPGTLIRLEREELPRFFSPKISPHQIDLREVLVLAELRGTLPALTVAIGVEPESVRMRTSLSPVVSAAMERTLGAVLDQLTMWGHPPDRAVANYA